MEFYHKFFPYAVAISWTAIALLLKLWLAPFLSRTIGAFFYIAIIVSTWYGGFRSGFVAVVLSTLAINYFFTPPQYQLGIERPEDVFQLAIFFLVAFTLNLLTSNFRDSKQKIELQQSELFEQVQTELAERKLVIAALQEREAILRLFAQYVPAGIAMFDRDMHYLIASQRWVDEYNLESVESLINRSHYEIFPEIPERWRQIHQRCLAGAIEKCEEDLFVRADGTQQWIWWEIHPWHTATDEIGGIIIFSVDITNRKHIEIALRESQIQLQRQLAEIETIYQS
ncbi:MAG TPA: hypothetical protein DDZ80_09430, partial [Cyanobacteria bacterium UBA8803]|nr:hypothetical protein [Cyanobacteria bacterium UBA8803]